MKGGPATTKQRAIFRLAAAAAILAFAMLCNARAAEPTPADILKLDKMNTQIAGIGDFVRLHVVGLDGLLAVGKIDLARFTLSLDDRSLPGLPIGVGTRGTDELRFELLPNAEGDNDKALRRSWSKLLGKAKEESRPVEVKLAYAEAPIAVSAGAAPMLQLRVYEPRRLRIVLVGLALIVALLFWLAISSDIIRDSDPPEVPPKKRRPYSLARFQMAWWFILVVGAFLYVFALTGNYDTITEQALILMGIAAATAVSASLIDTNKNGAALGKLDELRPRQAAIAEEIRQSKSRLADLQSEEKTLLQRSAAGDSAATTALPETRKKSMT